jgi:hypothetical protein
MNSSFQENLKQLGEFYATDKEQTDLVEGVDYDLKINPCDFDTEEDFPNGFQSINKCDAVKVRN